MRFPLVALLFAGVLIGPAHARLSASAAAFLNEIGVDPASADVKLVSNDVVSNDDVQGVSLTSLAAKRDEEGVKRFIATRVFIHKYMKDTNTQEPSAALYDTQYLTKSEQNFMFCQVAKGMNVSQPGC
jgi:hypothetical protein